MDIKKLRPDWKIAREFSRSCGLAAARDWMKAPMIDLRGCLPGFADLGALKVGKASLKYEEVRREADWHHMPFDDAVYIGDFGDHLFAMRIRDERTAPFPFSDMEHVWDGSQWDGPHKHTPSAESVDSMFENDDPTGGGNVTHVVQLFVLPDGGEWGWVVTMPVDANRSENGSTALAVGCYVPSQGHPTGKEASEWIGESIRVAMTIASACLVYVEKTTEHFVEVRPEPKQHTKAQRKKADKTKRNFPWLNPDVPRIIMLDAKRNYPSHGRSPSNGSGEGGGVVIPYKRWGHWRTYRHERFKNVKGQRKWIEPYWVGDKEWRNSGDVYRVRERNEDGKVILT